MSTLRWMLEGLNLVAAPPSPPTCQWCARGFPVGAFGFNDRHAIDGWDGEVRFEPCPTPASAIPYGVWKTSQDEKYQRFIARPRRAGDVRG